MTLEELRDALADGYPFSFDSDEARIEVEYAINAIRERDALRNQLDEISRSS